MNTERLFLRTAPLMMILWGGVMLYFHASGRMTAYLKADTIFRPLALGAGVALVAIGVFVLLTLRHAAEDSHGHHHAHDDGDHDHSHDHDSHACCDSKSHEKKHAVSEKEHVHHAGCCSDHSLHSKKHDHEPHGCCNHSHHHESHDEDGCAVCEHSHGPGSVGIWAFMVFMLTLPLLYAAKYSPDEDSSLAVTNKGVYDMAYGQNTADSSMGASAPSGMESIPSKSPVDRYTKEDLYNQISRSPDGYFKLEVAEIFYTAGEEDVREALAGEPVTTTAQILPEKVNNPNGSRMRIFRMMVQCCAADSRPFSIPIEFGKEPPKIKDMSWVEIRGRLTYLLEGGVMVPVLNVESWNQTDAPVDRLAY